MGCRHTSDTELVKTRGQNFENSRPETETESRSFSEETLATSKLNKNFRLMPNATRLRLSVAALILQMPTGHLNAVAARSR